MDFSRISNEDLSTFIKSLGQEPTGDSIKQATELFYQTFNYPLIIKERVNNLSLNYEDDHKTYWPASIVKLFYDTYVDFNPRKILKLSPFNSEIDGYFSVAKELVDIYNNSDWFRLKEYEGQGEFYLKYLDIYQNYLDELLKLIDDHPDKTGVVDLKCVNSVTEYVNMQAENKTLTPNTIMKAYFILFAYIDYFKQGKYTVVNSEYSCNNPMFNVEKDLADSSDHSRWTQVPLVCPRGVYGVNTFLYSYWNMLFPIGITTNPIIVHGVEIGTSLIANIKHDLLHQKIIRGNSRRFFISDYLVYNYILSNQKQIGIEKSKGLIFILFMMIHEAYAVDLIEVTRLILLYWYDWWFIFMRNKYYIPTRYNIVFQTEYYPDEPIDMLDPTSENFRVARNNNLEFHNNIINYLKAATKEMYKDYKQIESQIVNEVNSAMIIPSR